MKGGEAAPGTLLRGSCRLVGRGCSPAPNVLPVSGVPASESDLQEAQGPGELTGRAGG